MTPEQFRAKCKHVDKDLQDIVSYWMEQQTDDVWSVSSNEFQRLQKQRKTVIEFADFIHHATITTNGGTY